VGRPRKDPGVLSVRETADVLGVSPQRVRQMIHDGLLPAHRSSAGWLIPSDAAARRAEDAAHGRPTSARTAWAAITMLAAAGAAGADAEAAAEAAAGPADAVPDRRLRHRVLEMIRNLPDPADDIRPWRRLLGSRGTLRRMWVHPGVLDRLLADARIRGGGGSADAIPGLDALTGGRHQYVIYVSSDDSEGVIRRYRMADDPDGQIRLIVVPGDLLPGRRHRSTGLPAPAVAADLLAEADPRAHNAAVRLLRAYRRALLEGDGGRQARR